MYSTTSDDAMAVTIQHALERYLRLVANARIGVDESGKGDFFGPLVVAACYVGPEHYAELEGVQDSKKLTDEWMVDIPEDERRKILFENAEQLYHL